MGDVEKQQESAEAPQQQPWYTDSSLSDWHVLSSLEMKFTNFDGERFCRSGYHISRRETDVILMLLLTSTRDGYRYRRPSGLGRSPG